MAQILQIGNRTENLSILLGIFIGLNKLHWHVFLADRIILNLEMISNDFGPIEICLLLLK